MRVGRAHLHFAKGGRVGQGCGVKHGVGSRPFFAELRKFEFGGRNLSTDASCANKPKLTNMRAITTHAYTEAW